MNLHQLNVFKTIVETGSFSKAAAELSIAQSAVSYHIKLLENEIGDPLFLRVKTRVHLTETGRLLWKHVEKIFQAVEETRRAMIDRTLHHAGELHFGLAVSSLSDQLPEFLRHFKEICPRVSFNVVMGSPPQVIEQIRHNKLDLGIVSLPVEGPDLSSVPLFYEEEEMVVVVHRDSPLAARTETSPADLETVPLILYNRTTTTRHHLDDFFRTASVTPVVFMEMDREEAIMSSVESGLGATILPRCVLSNYDDRALLRFLRLQDAYLRRQVGVVTLNSPSRPYLVELAVRLCQQHFQAGTARAVSTKSPRASGASGKTVALPLEKML
ncbi:MAG: LysR family transcriptional regulator [Acidobacteriota bacterium]